MKVAAVAIALLLPLHPALAVSVVEAGFSVLFSIDDYANQNSELEEFTSNVVGVSNLSGSVSTALGNVSVTTGYSWNAGPGGVIFRTDNATSVGGPNSNAFLQDAFSFTVTEDTTYEIFGLHQSIGYTWSDYRVELTEYWWEDGEFFSEALFWYSAESTDTFSEAFQASNLIGGEGDNDGAHGPQGTLYAGRTYSFRAVRNFGRLSTRPPPDGVSWDGVGMSSGFSCLALGDASCSQDVEQSVSVPLPTTAVIGLFAVLMGFGFLAAEPVTMGPRCRGRRKS